MYGLTNYQLTGIQKGIQFLHGVVEYSQMVNKIGGHVLDIYNDWADNHKTVILLNGGTTNNKISSNGIPFGSLNNHLQTLRDNDIFCGDFYEPDLGDQLTSIVFIVDERVFNKKDYPDFSDWLMASEYADLIRTELGSTVYTISENIKNSTNKQDRKAYNEWVKSVGGEKNVFLREFLKNFRLA